MRNLFLAAILVLPFQAALAAARDEIPGPVEAKVLRVIDGDTLLVEARPWPQQKVEVYVRIRGIDTPELRSSCLSERQTGAAAKASLERMTSAAPTVHLSHISGDKYFGRVVADVTLPDGARPADHLLLAGLAVGYDGGRKSKISCTSP
nr:nuclease [Rhizobium sp. Q54]